MSRHFDFNATSRGGHFRDQENFNAADTINGAWILQGGKDFRMALIILAAINMAAAIVMIGNILFDAWTVRKWDFETKLQRYFGWLSKMHPAEMFPLIISVAVVLQNLIVIPVQGINTDSILFRGCGRTVQLIWPAIWFAPITMVVFGVETTFRSLRRNKFASRNRWHIPTALAVIIGLSIFLWAASNVFPTRGACVTGLIWWTARYFKFAIVICSGLLFLFTTSAIIITVQLVKTVKVDRAERIAATRVVYYLVVNTWIILFVLPYYIQIATNTRAQMSAQIAEIALNVSGIINLTMHIFLRSNADRLAIRGAATPWSEKRTMRVFGPSDLNMREHISYPVLWQASEQDNASSDANSEKSSFKSTETSDNNYFETPTQHAVFPSPDPNRPFTPSLKMSPVRRVTRNNSAYTVFPTLASSQQAHLSTSTTFSHFNDEYETPLPPPPLFAKQHERSDSAQTRQSSATVQIGLRLSYMNHALEPLDASPPAILPFSLQSTDSIPENLRIKRPDLRRASASSDAVNFNTISPAQSYQEAQTRMPNLNMPQANISPAPRAQTANAHPSSSRVELSKPEPALGLETLTSQVFKRPQKQTASPNIPAKPQFTINTTRQLAENAAAVTTPRSANVPALKLPAAPLSGAAPGQKVAPSWRPQNWNTNRDTQSGTSSAATKVRQDESHGRKGSGSDKGLPKVPESAQLDESPLGRTTNPWNVSKVQVIQRPPGWV
ncbi:MAG: hypothetical protein Q9195_006773 [Heterodermia aff. obscurata]